MEAMEEGKTVTVPLKLISDAVEQADENWNQYLDVEKMESAIRGSGAFRRFKDSIMHYGIEKDWYDFLEEAHRRIARECLP